MGLAIFHVVVNAVMGWENCHLHRFSARGLRWGPYDEFRHQWEDDFADESAAVVEDLLTRVKSKARYLYDFGDGWDHDLVLEEVLRDVPMEVIARCTGGERACPPEDSGGVWGFYRFLEILENPNHPEHEHKWEWNGARSPRQRSRWTR